MTHRAIALMASWLAMLIGGCNPTPKVAKPEPRQQVERAQAQPRAAMKRTDERPAGTKKQRWASSQTRHVDQDELWLQHERFQKGRRARGRTMWTDHKRGEALPASRMTILASCEPTLRIRANEAGQPGVFVWHWAPKAAGPCRLTFRAFTPQRHVEMTVDIVVAAKISANPSGPLAKPNSRQEVGFSMDKPAQWLAHVRTAGVTRRLLRQAHRVNVTVEPGPHSRLQILAPAAGTIGRPTTATWPSAHVQVQRGKPLVTLALNTPRPLRGLPTAWLPTDRSRRDLDSPVASLTLRSPGLMTVSGVSVHPGQRVAARAPIVILTSDTQVGLRVTLSPNERKSLGDKPQLLLLPDNRRTIPVAMFGARANADGHLLIPYSSPTSALRVGERVPAAIEYGDGRSVVSIPAAAILRAGQEAYVFVQRSATRFERRVVRVGRWSGDAWEVQSGLVVEERVVIDGFDAVRAAQSRARAIP